jgi:hypothetical protein
MSRCCAIAAVLAMIMAPPVIVPFAIPYVLGLLGFAAVGVTAGSWAALWQATFGIGMMFSILQGLAIGWGRCHHRRGLWSCGSCLSHVFL